MGTGSSSLTLHTNYPLSTRRLIWCTAEKPPSQSPPAAVKPASLYLSLSLSPVVFRLSVKFRVLMPSPLLRSHGRDKPLKPSRHDSMSTGYHRDRERLSMQSGLYTPPASTRPLAQTHTAIPQLKGVCCVCAGGLYWWCCEKCLTWQQSRDIPVHQLNYPCCAGGNKVFPQVCSWSWIR